MRCLCCNKEIENPTEYESHSFWHTKCMKKFFGTETLPELDFSEEKLTELANLTVSKGLTVPGVQKKLSLHLSKENKTARLTLVNYPTGYILKPQSESFANLPEAEFLSMKMAELAKIRTVPHGLLRFQDSFAYITKRIDRDNSNLYAMEDFCQLSGRLTTDKYRSSYENCGKVIRRYSQNVGLDMTEFFYRLLFCFATGNSDMHLKNFSLIEDSPGSRIFSLSPAYDMLPVNIIMPADKEQMALTLNGKKRNLRKNDFLSLAENLKINKKVAMDLISRILSYQDMFGDLIQNSYLPDAMRYELANLMQIRMNSLK